MQTLKLRAVKKDKSKKNFHPEIGELNTVSKWKMMKNSWQLYLFMSMAIAVVFIFSYIPMYGVLIAFKNFSAPLGILGSPWADNFGFQHFIDFFNSFHFWRLLRNTLHLNIYSLIFSFPFPIILALILNEAKDGIFKKITQTVTYAPHFISVVVMAGMTMSFLNPSTGIINNILAGLGFERVAFLSIPEFFAPVYVWSGIWQSAGWGSIIYLAALAGVDPTLHEAAIMDGASRLQRVWHINLPAIKPTIIILLIMSVGSLMSTGFERIFLLTNPMNAPRANVIATYVFEVGLERGRMDFAAAIGLFNTVINAFLLIVVNKVTKKVSEVGLW